MSIDAMKQALESIDFLRHHLTRHHACLHMKSTSGISEWLNKTEYGLRQAIENGSKPLTDEEVAVIAAACGGLASDFVVDVARAIEKAHGIKGEA